MAKRQMKIEASDSSARRSEILRLAAKVFAERGIKAATVRDIGDAAGILSGSLYHHFKSKDQMALDLLLPNMEASHASASAICAKLSGLPAMAALIRDAILASAAEPDVAVILRKDARLFAEIPTLTPIEDLRAKIVSLWFMAIEQGIAAGEIRENTNPQIVARAILDGTSGASRWFNGTREATPIDVVDSLVDFYIEGLKRR
jgi:TetR/AcrR family transcriptional regulator, cholesterol catabolism regulator